MKIEMLFMFPGAEACQTHPHPKATACARNQIIAQMYGKQQGSRKNFRHQNISVLFVGFRIEFVSKSSVIISAVLFPST
jgi:hypothetical protein